MIEFKTVINVNVPQDKCSERQMSFESLCGNIITFANEKRSLNSQVCMLRSFRPSES